MSKFQLSFFPINDWIMSSEPIMTKDHFVCFGLSEQEVESLLVVTHHEGQVNSILDWPFLILSAIHVSHTDQFL